MENNNRERFVYRLKYGRGSDVRYVSHLDMLKLFDRASRRGGLPVAYSSGFNPHPLFVFGMPLPVGVTSEAEYVDIELSEREEPENIVLKLNGAMPPSVRIFSAERLPAGAENIMKSVVASEYSMLLDLGGEPVESFDAILEVFKNRKPLIVMKRTKSGTRETDIMPMINAIEPTTLEKGELARIKITTAAGNVTNLRPELAVNALAEKANVPVRILGIHRLSLIWEFEA